MTRPHVRRDERGDVVIADASARPASVELVTRSVILPALLDLLTVELDSSLESVDE
jgi:hypothetical protein